MITTWSSYVAFMIQRRARVYPSNLVSLAELLDPLVNETDIPGSPEICSLAFLEQVDIV